MSTTTITQMQGYVHDGVAHENFAYERDIESLTGAQAAAQEAEIQALLAPSKEVRAAAAAALEHSQHLTLCENASAVATARSLESRGEADHRLAAPAASALESASSAAADGVHAGDLQQAYFDAHDIFNMLGTLCDRFPRRASRTESGHWQRSGVIKDVLDTISYGFERRWERADVDYRRACDELREAEEGLAGGEIDRIAVTQAEDRAVERGERADFMRHLYHAARRSYELLVGAPWQTRGKIAHARAVELGLANVTIAKAETHVFKPPNPAVTQRVIVMGGGAEDVPELPAALAKLKAKHPALTLYTGDRDVGPEAAVARFAVVEKVQVVRIPLDRKHGQAAAFRRIYDMLATAKPHGIVVCGPRSHGPTQELVNVAAKAGIPIWDVRNVAVEQKAPPVGA